MANPGAASSQIPYWVDRIPREIEDLRRQLRELGPSIAQSFNGTVADLKAAMARTSLSVSVRATTNNFDIPAYPAYKELSTPLIVPADVTSCTVIVSASVGVTQTGSGNKDLNLSLYSPITGDGHQATVAANMDADLTGTWVDVIPTVTPGSTLTFMVRASSMTVGMPFPLASANRLEISAVAIFKY